MNLGGNLGVKLGGKTHNFATTVFVFIYTRKPCYHKENRAMPPQISVRIEFYNKSIMERLGYIR